MKIIILTITTCLILISTQAQDPPKLIIRADDMGSSHSANLACIESYKNGIARTIEVMAVAPWFPEAVRLLNENQGVEVGLHLTITSEWDNIKWRPLTHCPSLTDQDGYFLPRMSPHTDLPGQSIMENDWKIEEIEREFRAQIELALKNIPQLNHLSGHMRATGFDKKVAEMALRLAKEYRLPLVDGNPETEFGIINFGYSRPKDPSERLNGFSDLLNGLEAGNTYCFLDHPGLDNLEMQAFYHKGYEDVAVDRQGVTDLFTSESIIDIIQKKGIVLTGYNEITRALPRSTPEAERLSGRAIGKYLDAVNSAGQELHSLMILRHGKVVAEHWFGEHTARTGHRMWSVSKAFTSAAIGFAVAENEIRVTDKVITFFPDDLPEEVAGNLSKLEIRHLLTMTTGHATDPTNMYRETATDWVRKFLAYPVEFEPGTHFVYNSLATYMLSAILHKVTGESLTDYLYPRLFRPLGISGVEWMKSPEGISTGGWGLFIKTEDMAKFGQFMLNKGNWEGRQLLSESWFEEATKAHSVQPPAWIKPGVKARSNDWQQGYGYQLWRCRHNAFRADGRYGQFIIVLPEKDAVIVTTANIQDMEAQIELIWKHLLPAFK